MTRETKIGLLVGLAFIIVIGILLSDHMSSTTEPPQASVGGAGSNVREGVTTPGGEPRAPVTTKTDLQPAPPPRVAIGPANSGQPPITIRQTGGTTPPTAPREPSREVVGLNDLPPTLPTDVQIPRAAPRGAVPLDPGLRELVLKHPADFAAVGQGGNTGSAKGKPALGPDAPRTYTAESGDSVSRITAKMYGTSTKSNRDLFIKANPPLQAEGAPVIVGKTYVVPNLPGTPATPAGTGTRTTVAGAPAPAPAPTGKPALASGETWYVVQDNDNLWRIAEAQLGNGNLWTAIRDNNKDILKGGETVHANMRLRLPGKPVASASAN